MEVLTIVFIVLKLCGVISWSWWWVLSPIIFQLAFVLLCLGALIVLVVLRALLA